MSKNLENNTALYEFLYSLLIVGERKDFIIDNPVIQLAYMYGYVNNKKPGYSIIANKILELRLNNYFISKDSNVAYIGRTVSSSLLSSVVSGGRFNMELCLQKFAEHYREIFSEKDLPFLERHGRLIFISYLRPLINGRGFYHIESQFTDMRRMDIVVDFEAEQFIIELKLWKGEAAQEDAYEQLAGYMKTKNAKRGYLLTFDFRKGKREAPAAGRTMIGECEIFEVTV